MNYRVSYSVTRKDGQKWADAETTVHLREGYSDFTDIPKIVGLPRGLKEDEILIRWAILLPDSE